MICLTAIWTALSFGEAYAFSVAPPRVEIVLLPGGVYEDAFTVTNTQEETILLDVGLEDRSVGAAKTGRGQQSLEWLKIHSKTLEIAPGKSGAVNYTITVPKGARGERLARISFTKAPLPGKTMLGVQSVMTFSIYVIIEGTEVIEGDISGIYIFKTDPLEVRVTMQNSGNIHIRPGGEVILVKDGWSGESDRHELSLPLNKYEFPVYPFSERTWKIKSEEKIDPGKYEARVNMEFGPQNMERVFTFSVSLDGKASEARIK